MAEPIDLNDVLESRRREARAAQGEPETQIEDEGVADFFATAAESIQWLLEPFVPRGAFVVVQGGPKSGKTWFGAWLAAQVAARGLKVAVIEEEGPREVLRDRLLPFVPDPLALNGLLRVLYRKRIRLDQPAVLAALVERYKGFDLIILDPFIRLHGRKEKDSDEMMIPLAAIAALIAETGAAVVLIHHTKKGESWHGSGAGEAQLDDGRGSGTIAGEADNVIAIRRVPRNERAPGFVKFFVENPGSRMGAEFERKKAIVDLALHAPAPLTWADTSVSESENGVSNGVDLVDEAIDKIINSKKLPKTSASAISATTISRILRCNKAAALEAAKRLERHGVLEVTQGKWGPIYFKPEKPNA